MLLPGTNQELPVRFPRMLCWREDKPVEKADTLDNLKQILEQYK